MSTHGAHGTEGDSRIYRNLVAGLRPQGGMINEIPARLVAGWETDMIRPLFFLGNLLSPIHLLVRQGTGRMCRICLSLLLEYSGLVC